MDVQYVQPIELDVANCNLYKCIYAKQDDAKSRYIKATILVNGEKKAVSSDMRAMFRAVKPDGKAIYNPAIVNDDGTVTAELTQQTLAVEGTVDADILIMSSDGEELSTAPFKIEVEKAPSGSLADSKNEMLVLQKLIDDSEAALKKLGNVKDGKDGVSPTVSTAATTGGTKVTITDAKGSHEFVVKDGARGAPGKNGSDATVTAASIAGALGYKPAAPGDIPVVPTAEISANTAARHSHANKGVLDGITAAKIAAWDGKSSFSGRYADLTGKPAALKNPNALTIKIGGTTVTYDGSAAKTVTIADGSEVAY